MQTRLDPLGFCSWVGRGQQRAAQAIDAVVQPVGGQSFRVCARPEHLNQLLGRGSLAAAQQQKRKQAAYLARGRSFALPSDAFAAGQINA